MVGSRLCSGNRAVNKTDKNKHTRKYIMCQMVISAIKKNLSKRNKEWLGVARRSEVLCTVASQIRNF